MSIESAQRFVTRMREDSEFRSRLSKFPNAASMKTFIVDSGFVFDEAHLVAAMAACMNEMDEQSGNHCEADC